VRERRDFVCVGMSVCESWEKTGERERESERQRERERERESVCVCCVWYFDGD